MEAISKFYLEDGHIEGIDNYTEDSKEKYKIIYEVIRVIDKVPLFYEEHIKRLETSFKLMETVFSYEYDKIKEYLLKLIEANEVNNGNIKLTFDISTDTMKVFYIKHNYPSEELYKNGVKTILYHGERINPNAKVVDNSFREKVSAEINKAGAFEAILVNNQGYITEGSKSNIFLIKDNKLITSPIKEVLPGITRGRIIDVAKKLGIEVIEENVSYNELSDFQAMFISGTSPKILPIATVDNISLDVNNKVMRELMEVFNIEIYEYVKNFKNKLSFVS